jgi:hypothetical protein
MRSLEVGVGLVLGVALAVVLQRHRLRALVVADIPAAGHVRALLVLVLVVAEVQHQVRLVLGEAAVGREETVLVLGTAGEGHGQGRRRFVPGRAGQCAADRTDVAAGAEPVEVLAPGLQAAQFRMDRVGAFRQGLLHAALNDVPHRSVLSNLPGHGDNAGGHAAQPVFCERVEREPGPEHEAVGPGVAGRDAEGEGICREARFCVPGIGDGGAGQGDDEASTEAAGDECSASDVHGPEPNGAAWTGEDARVNRE